MTNIQTTQVNADPATIQKIFQKYNVVSEYPIDYKAFVTDIVNATSVATTIVFTQSIDHVAPNIY